MVKELGCRLNRSWHWVRKLRQLPGSPSYLSGWGIRGTWKPGRRLGGGDSGPRSGKAVDAAEGDDAHGAGGTAQTLVGIHGQARSWFGSYLSDRYQFVNFNNFNINLELDLEYHKDLCVDLCSSLYICFPWDKSFTNMALTSTAMQMTPSCIYQSSLMKLPKMEACLLDIKEWMTQNFLLLNSDKTEIMVVGPKSLRHYLSAYMPNIDPSRQVL